MKGLLVGYEKIIETTVAVGSWLEGPIFGDARRITWKHLVEHLYQVELHKMMILNI